MHLPKSLLRWTAALALSTLSFVTPAAAAPPGSGTTVVQHRFIEIDGHRVFYREAGPAHAPVLLLLHGFPTSSHLFRELMPKLALRYRVIAPDLPGFGLTQVRTGPPFQYSFDQLAQVVDRFTEVKRIPRYALYVFDIGAPVGWRLAVAHPQRITAIVSQNGNAYEEGLSPAWDPIRQFWKDDSPQHRDPLRKLFTLETTKWQYLEGVAQASRVAPEGYLLDQMFLDRPGQQEIQLALLRDYRNNLVQYAALHDYFRRYRPPLLAVWGAADPFFLPAGARAFQRDLPKAEVHLLAGAGHFALASHGDEIARQMMLFLGRHVK